ncbi:MAG: hypothetical protein UT75_C0014G0001, partial [Candidatus Yanofskybacteria bacterium GW2011_GWE2_40_11]
GASISGNFDPSTDNIYDLGDSSYRWRDLNLGRNALIAGNVGIGTTVAGYPLVVQTAGTGTTVSSNIIARLQSNGSGYASTLQFSDNVTYSSFITMLAGDLHFSPNGVSSALVVQKTNGNVGIGTTTPGTILNIVKAGTGFRQQSTSTNWQGLDILTNSGAAVQIYNNYSGTETEKNLILGTYTNRANQLVLASSGNVGIGTTGPGYPLEIAKTTTGAQSLLHLHNLDGNTNSTAGITFGITSTAVVMGKIEAIRTDSPSSVNTDLSFSTYNAALGTPLRDVMRITSTGNVGIGTTSPSQKLDVNGNITVSSSGVIYGNDVRGISGNFYLNYAGGGITAIGNNGALRIAAGEASSVMNITSGNVGIGTTSPGAKLQVVGTNGLMLLSDVVTDATQKIGRLGVPHYTNIEEPVAVFVGNSASGSASIISFGGGSSVFNAATKLSFFTAANATTVTGTERMTIDSSGNVGIGTTTPAHLLSVVKNQDDATFISVFNAGTGVYSRAGIRIGENAGNNNVTLAYGNNSYNLGVGAELLSANTGHLFTNTSATGGLSILTLANAPIIFGTAGYATTNERVRITGVGNVGIGTTTPSAKLDVNGTVNIGGNLAGWTGVYDFVVNSANGGIVLRRTGTNEPFMYLSTDTVGSGGQVRGLNAGGLRFADAGASNEWMRITGGGNVGIGTTNPATFKLEIAGNIGPDGDNTRDIGSSGRRYANIYATNIVGSVVPSGFTQGPVIFGGVGGALAQDNGLFWDNNTKMLGIGTTGPSQALHISGNMRLTGAFYDLNNEVGNSGQVLTTTGAGVDWVDAGSIATRWSSIVSPSANLSLSMNTYTTGFNWATGTGTNDLFSFTTDASANGTGSLVNIQTGTSSTISPLRVRAGTTEALAITPFGNVGIGTTNAIAALELRPATSFTGPLFLVASGSVERLRVTSDGNLGIGTTSPGALVDIKGTSTSSSPALRVNGGGYVDLPTGQKISSEIVANDLIFYLPFTNSLASTRGNYDYFTRADTASGSTSTFTMESGRITHDYVYTNYPRLEKSNMGHGVWIENARRNLMTYSSFEDAGSITGWTNSGLETFTTTSSYTKHQSYAASLGDTNATGGQAYIASTLTNGQSYPFFCYAMNNTTGSIRGTVDSTVVQLWAGADLSTTYTLTEGGWYKISGTITGTGGAVNYGVDVKASKGIYLDGCQIEADYATTNGVPYGTTLIYNNSTNQRNRGEETLYYYSQRGSMATYGNDTLVNADKGTVSLWFKPDWAANQPAVDLYFLQVTNVLQIFYSAADDKIYAQMYNGSNWTTASVTSATQTFAANTNHFLSFRWDASAGTTLNVDGVETSYGSSWTSQDAQITSSTAMYIGSKATAGGRIDALVSDFAVFGRALNKAEVGQLYVKKAPIEDYQRSDQVMLQLNNRVYQQGSIRVNGEIYGGSISTGTVSTTYLSSSYFGVNNAANITSHIIMHLPFQNTIDGSRKEKGTFSRSDVVAGSATAGDEATLKLINKNAGQARIDRGFVSNAYYYDTSYNTGNFGVNIEDSRKNIVTNSSFETGTPPSDWTAQAGCTATKVSRLTMHGSSSVNLASTAACRYYQTVNLTGAAVVHQISAYVWRNETNALGMAVDSTIAGLYASTGLATTALSTVYTPLGNGWYRMTAQFTGTAADWYVGIYLPSASRNVYVDSIQVERNAADSNTYFPSTYIPTSTSTAIRAAETLSYAVPAAFKSEKGAVSLWFKPNWTRNITSDVADKYLLYIPNVMRIRLVGASDYIVIEHYNGSSWVATVNTATTTVSQYYWNHLVCSWYNNYNYCRLNGGAYASSATWTPQDPTGKLVYIGSDDAGANQVNGQIAAFALFDTYLDASQQYQLYLNRGKFDDYYRTDAPRLIDQSSDTIQEGKLSISNDIITFGNMGIGIATPTTSFEIFSSTRDALMTLTASSSSEYDPGILFRINNNGVPANIFSLGVDNSDGDKFKISGGLLGVNDRFTIDSVGNIGIGTTAPLAKLEIQGTASASNLLTSGSLQVANGGASVSYSRFGTGSTTHGLSNASDLLISGNLEIDGNTYFDGTVNFSTIASSAYIYAQDGSAASPSFSFSNDKDTGLFRPGNNSLGITTGAVERLTIASDGNVGIGTTSPGQKLSIAVGNIGIDQNYAYGDITYPTYAGIIPRTSSNASLVANSLQNMYFNIDSDSTEADTNAFIFAKNNNGVSGAELMRIQENGNVGIGTTGPGSLLEIYKDTNGIAQLKINNPNAGSSAYTSLVLGNDAGSAEIWRNSAARTVYGGANALNIYQSGAYPIAFFQGTSEIMRIHTNGNVGIGTTTPLQKLDVNGALYIRGYSQSLLMGANSALSSVHKTKPSAIIHGYPGGNTPEFTSASLAILDYRDITTDFSASGFSPNGIYLGHSRSATVGTPGVIVQNNDVLGALYFLGDDGVDFRSAAAYIGAQVDGTPGANDMPGRLVFGTTPDGAQDSVERMRITNSGNVGISTTNPGTNRLQVNGANVLFTHNAALDVRIDNSSTGNASLTIDRQTTAGESKILFLDGGTTQWGIGAKTSTNNFVIRDADSTERLTILKAGGNVGIGTASPTLGTLQVNGTIYAAGNMTMAKSASPTFTINNSATPADGVSSYITFNGTSGGTDYLGGLRMAYRGGTANNQKDLDFYAGGNSSIPVMVVEGTGNVGIGTTAPTNKLQVAGSILSTNLISSGIGQFGGTSTVSYSRFGTNTTTHSLSSANDVLISGKLEVDGDIFVDGTLYAGA